MVGSMEVYVEYAILENLLVDGALLYLAQTAAGQRIHALRLLLASALGAVFAVLFPLLSMASWLTYLCKFAVGGLLCVIAIKRQNGRGRYALTMLLFYALSFCFGGGLIAVFSAFGVEYYTVTGGGILSKVPVGGLLGALAVFVAVGKWGVRKLYERKRACAHVYPCEIALGEKVVKVDGFLDTGNTASYLGKAVCFVTPDVLYRLYGVAAPKERMAVRTVSGGKQVGLFPVDEVRILDGNQPTILHGAYLSPAVHILGKNYQMLLPWQ